ncbi:MAG: HAMP domain-containing protein [Deltaproteobacteria bacterium]|nr:HAMP domain-containing protein [Deltaproteobacteria bacterium]
MLPIRTISGRIVLGFFVLMATFSGVSGYTIYKLADLGRELRFIRTAYLEVSLQVAKLQSLQGGIVDYLEDYATPRKPLVDRNRSDRRKLLQESADKLDALGKVPSAHRPAIVRMRERIDGFLQEYAENGPLYDLALSPSADPETARGILARLKQNERRLQQRIRAWFTELRGSVEYTMAQLERAEEQARFGALVLGAISVLVGLLVTVWAVLTLRPLGRLRDSVRKIAGGDYRARVEVAGETEVAEVAREFNAMAAAIEEREQELVRSERLAVVGKMAAVITHEIRNPLSSIGLNAELLEDELARLPKAPETLPLCRTIHKEVDRLTAITEEYLRFARLPRPKLEPEQVNSIVSGLVEFQKEELGLAGIRVDATLASELPLVAVDDGQLRQAFLNLVRNAAEAMSQGGGALSFATRLGDGAVEIQVRDTGPGIPVDVLPKIFEPFFSTKERGTGLGLALTQQIIAEHGGRVDVETAEGKGTTFTVRLPLIQADQRPVLLSKLMTGSA